MSLKLLTARGDGTWKPRPPELPQPASTDALSCRAWCGFRGLLSGGVRTQCQVMTNFTEVASVSSGCPGTFTDQLRLAVAAYLARFKGSCREHTESDLRCYLTWCAERGLDPLAAWRPPLELYIRWMQEIRRFKPSTVSRRFSVTAGFYRTAVIDGLLEHSPAEHVRRPSVPAESPTLGFTHPQFEALLAAARQSGNNCDFALVAMLGFSARGSMRPPARTSPTWVKSTATGYCAFAAKAPRSSWSHCRQPSAAPSTRQLARALAGRSCSTPAAPGWTAMRPPGACAGSPRRLAYGSPERIHICCATLS